MADFSNAKDNRTAAYPVHAKEWTGELAVYEPVLDVKTFKSRYLKFVDTSAYTDDEIRDRIKTAMNEAEIELGVPIVSRIFEDKLPFDRNLYKRFVHIQTRVGPIRTLLEFAIYSANNELLFRIPNTWVDLGQAHRRQLNVIPYLASYGANTVSGNVSNAGIAFLASLDAIGFLASYWQIQYKAGLSCEDGTIPVIANQLIGCYAAIDILSNLGPQNRYTSTSLGQDGISQSTGGPGPALYAQRMQELETKKQMLIKKMKGKFANKFSMTNI